MLPEQGQSHQKTIAVYGTYAAWYQLAVHAYEGGTNTLDGCSKCSLEVKINDTRHASLTDICTTFINE